MWPVCRNGLAEVGSPVIVYVQDPVLFIWAVIHDLLFIVPRELAAFANLLECGIHLHAGKAFAWRQRMGCHDGVLDGRSYSLSTIVAYE